MVNIERRGTCRNLELHDVMELHDSWATLEGFFFFWILGAYENVEDVLMLLVRRKGGGLNCTVGPIY